MFRKIKIILLLFFFKLTNNVVSQTKFAIIGDSGWAEVGGDGIIEAEKVANMIDTLGVEFIVTTADNNYVTPADQFTMDENTDQFYHEWMYPYNGSYVEGETRMELIVFSPLLAIMISMNPHTVAGYKVIMIILYFRVMRDIMPLSGETCTFLY